MSREEMHIEEATFVVVDVETTGVRATDRVIEVAAVKVRSGEIVDRFSTLVNPERSVPHRITRMTGISTAMLFGEPAVAEVMPRLLAFIGDAIFVAHNLSFDRRFVNGELKRVGRPELSNETLCTLRLARRLLPGLKSKGLGHVADHYGIKINARHRALGDAEATAEVLLRFLTHLGDERDIDTVRELLAFQNRTYSTSRAKKRPRHVQRIREEVLPRLPDRPGVYFMKDARHGIIYIGKAKDLNARVRTYFTAIEAHPSHTRKLVDAVREVEWRETGSELAALLLESRLIKQHKPRFNRAQRRYRNRPFLRLDTTEDYPRLSWTAYLRDDGAEYFGPLTSRRSAERVVELVDRFFSLRECDENTLRQGRRCLYAEMDRCLAPCVEAGSDYVSEVARVRAFLTGRDDAILELLEARMREAAARLDFEQAGFYRDALQTVEHLVERQQCVAAPVLEHNAVVVQPGVEPETVQLFLVRFGRLAETVTLPQQIAVEDRERLRQAIDRHFDPAMERPERYFKKEVDEVRLLLHWLYVNRDQSERVAWKEDADPDAFAEAVLERVEWTLTDGGEAMKAAGAS